MGLFFLTVNLTEPSLKWILLNTVYIVENLAYCCYFLEYKDKIVISLCIYGLQKCCEVVEAFFSPVCFSILNHKTGFLEVEVIRLKLNLMQVLLQ